MTRIRPQQRQRQLLLVLLLFLVGQLVLTLHTHDLSLHAVDAEECLLCPVITSDNPAPAPTTASIDISIYRGLPLPNFNVLLSQFQRALPQPRAPPIS